MGTAPKRSRVSRSDKGAKQRAVQTNPSSTLVGNIAACMGCFLAILTPVGIVNLRYDLPEGSDPSEYALQILVDGAFAVFFLWAWWRIRGWGGTLWGTMWSWFMWFIWNPKKSQVAPRPESAPAASAQPVDALRTAPVQEEAPAVGVGRSS